MAMVCRMSLWDGWRPTTLADANTIVDKIVNYDETVRFGRLAAPALFVADNTDAAGRFPDAF